MSELEQILCGTDDPSLYKTFHNTRQEVQELVVSPETALKSDNEGPPSTPTQTTTPAPDVLQTIPELLNHERLGASIRNIAQEEARRIYEFKLGKSLIKAAEDSLYYEF